MDPLNTGFSSNYKPLTIGDWLITFLIQAIPLVGFVMLFVWALVMELIRAKNPGHRLH